MHYARLSVILAATISIVGCTNMETQIKNGGSLGQVDRDYIDVEYRLAQLDDQEGELAKSKASDPRVAATATQLKSQADTLHPGLQAALQAEGVAPPDTPRVNAEVEKLRALNGAAFDRQYVADELSMHERAAKILQKESDDTKDDTLRLQVRAELPVVQDNLNRFKLLSQDLDQQKSASN